MFYTKLNKIKIKKRMILKFQKKQRINMLYLRYIFVMNFMFHDLRRLLIHTFCSQKIQFCVFT